MAVSHKNRIGSLNEKPFHAELVDLVVREGAHIDWADEVADSWRRSLTTHHLDPEYRAAPHIITESEIKICREPLHELILLAREEIDRLYTIVRPQDYVVLLCDRNGVAIQHRGDESKAEAFKHWGIWLGGVWAEDAEGTNGIGTCLTEEEPTVVHRGQHFRTRHTNLSCAGAPIFGPDGELAAVLDTSSMNPQTSAESLSLVMAATRVSVRGIEERLFREHFQHAWIIAAAPAGDVDTSALLAVDHDLRIVGADREARRIFTLADGTLKRGLALATIFGYDSSIFRCKGMQDLPARLVRTGTDQPWNILITPPACGMRGWCSPESALSRSRPRLGLLSNLTFPLAPAINRGGLPPARITRICEYIDSHLQENIALEALAQIAQLSVHHFARAFRQSVGLPPHNFVVQRRVARAQELLQNTDLSLSEIALKAGFTDQSHLARHYRRFTGASPGLARRRQR